MYRLFFVCVALAGFAYAQMEARFALPKEKYMSGEPILLEYTVRNTGTQPVTIPSAGPNSFFSGFEVKVNRTDVVEQHACGWGGFGGSCFSMSRRLDPGATITERYLVNDQNDMRTPGSYHVSASRELSTSLEPHLTKYSGPKVNTSADFDVEVMEPEAQQVRSVLLPYFADLNSDDWPRHNLATLVIGAVSSPAVEDLVLQVRDNPRTRNIAVRALAATNTPATRKQLAEIAAGSTDDRFSAASALGQSGDKSYWPLLRDLAQSLLALLRNYVRAYARRFLLFLYPRRRFAATQDGNRSLQ